MSHTDPTPGDSDPAVNPAGDGVDISDRDVAQGGTGTRTFTVLIISVVLVVLVLFAAFAISALTKGAPGPHGSGIGGANDKSAVFNATDTPSPKQNPPGAPGGS